MIWQLTVGVRDAQLALRLPEATAREAVRIVRAGQGLYLLEDDTRPPVEAFVPAGGATFAVATPAPPEVTISAALAAEVMDALEAAGAAETLARFAEEVRACAST